MRFSGRTLFIALGTILACIAISGQDRNSIDLRLSVENSQHSFLRGLTSEQVSVTVSGKPAKVSSMTQRSETDPISLGIVLDTSGSMHDFWNPDAVHAGALILQLWLSKLPAGSEYFVFNVASAKRTLLDWNRNPAEIQHAFPRNSAGETALLDSIAEAVQKLSPRTGTKALLVLSDGDDNSSVLTESRMFEILERSDVVVNALFQGIESYRPATVREMRQSTFLGNVTGVSGGRYLRFVTPGDFSAQLGQLTLSMENYFTLSLDLPPALKPGWQDVKIRIDRPDAKKLRLIGPQRILLPKGNW